MGYLTQYRLSAFGAPARPLIEGLRRQFEEADYALDEDGSEKERTTWYSHEDDLRSFSREHPHVIFSLAGYGEEAEDIWTKHFVDGKMQVCRAVITLPLFDPAKLE